MPIIGTPEIKKAFEQTADHIKMSVFNGSLARGERLPTELQLAEQFGVSRSTVREALRLLATEGLITSSKGPSGGHFIAHPTLETITSQLITQVNLLTMTSEISVSEMVELRNVLEVEAAGLAAQRRTEEELAILETTTVADLATASPEALSRLNRKFHQQLIASSRNRMLALAYQPINTVLENRVERSLLDTEFHERVLHDHLQILERVRAADEPGARAAMAAHADMLADFTPLVTAPTMHDDGAAR